MSPAAVAFAVVVALAGVGLWHGVDALVLLAGIALFLLGVDAVEGLAQETDHPERPEQYPVVWGELVLSHLLAPAVVLFGFAVAAALAIGAITGSVDALAVAAITVVPATLAGVVGAGLSVVMGAPPPTPLPRLRLPRAHHALAGAPTGARTAARRRRVRAARHR